MFVSSGFSVPGNAAPFDFVIDAKRVEDWSLFAFCFVVISFLARSPDYHEVARKYMCRDVRMQVCSFDCRVVHGLVGIVVVGDDSCGSFDPAVIACELSLLVWYCALHFVFHFEVEFRTDTVG